MGKGLILFHGEVGNNLVKGKTLKWGWYGSEGWYHNDAWWHIHDFIKLDGGKSYAFGLRGRWYRDGKALFYDKYVSVNCYTKNLDPNVEDGYQEWLPAVTNGEFANYSGTIIVTVPAGETWYACFNMDGDYGSEDQWCYCFEVDPDNISIGEMAKLKFDGTSL